MTPRFLLPVVGCFLLSVVVRADDHRKALDELQGTWKVTRVEFNGQTLPPETIEGWSLTVKSEKYTLRAGPVTVGGSIRLDLASDPRGIVATRTSGLDTGKTVQGIYELKGDRLKMCFNEPGRKKRPPRFATSEGSGYRCYTLERSRE